MAAICSALQKYHLPDSVASFGGLTFNAAGSVISSAMTMFSGRPLPSYAGMRRDQKTAQKLYGARRGDTCAPDWLGEDSAMLGIWHSDRRERAIYMAKKR
jgi:hypothetical protein